MPRKPSNSSSYRPWRRSRVIDFRGVQHDLLESADVPGSADAELKAAVSKANEHRLIKFLFRASLGVVVGSTVYGLLSWSLGNALSSIPSHVSFWLWGLFCVFAGAEVTRKAATNAVSLCFRHKICPACGYSLNTLAPDLDECTICPECGGAWKLSGFSIKPQ